MEDPTNDYQLSQMKIVVLNFQYDPIVATESFWKGFSFFVTTEELGAGQNLDRKSRTVSEGYAENWTSHCRMGNNQLNFKHTILKEYVCGQVEIKTQNLDRVPVFRY